MANPYTHVVKKGEHLFLLSDEYNVKPGVILEANPALKERENTLLPGEELVIPVNEEKDELGATEEHHPFGSDRSKVLLRLRILKGDFSPAVGAPYTLHIDGEEAARTGNTNGDGMIEENNIPMQTTDATLTVRILPPEPTDGNEPGEEISGAIPVVYSLKVGALEPIRTPCSEEPHLAGIQERLRNLHFYSGPVNGRMSDALKNAIRSFCRAMELPETDSCDANVLAKLEEVHDR